MRVPFSELPWEEGAHPLEQKKRDSEGRLTLLRFAPGFKDPNWCTRGHDGYVLAGALRMEFAQEAEEYRAGDAFSVAPGQAHRASNPGADPVVFFVVSSPD